MVGFLIKVVLGLIVLGYIVQSICRFLRLSTQQERAPVADERRLRDRRYRKVLGLQGNETDEQIKRSYRKLIAEYHPDKVQHMAPEIRKLAQQRTVELTEAYNYFKGKQQKS